MLTVSTAHAQVIYVNASATGANDGTTWDNAFTNLQNALTKSVAGNQIWVAKGIYKPAIKVDIDGNGVLENREVTFQIKSGVKLYGGFAGGEAALEDRDWKVNFTILSGDIDNNDLNADANFIAENTNQIIGNNAYHVVTTKNVTVSTLVDGVIITGGKADGLPSTSLNARGGGWVNIMAAPANASSPTMKNCTFQGSYAEREGGAWHTSSELNVKSEPRFETCQFINNTSNFGGGAIYIGSKKKGSYKPQIINCRFSGNKTFKYGGALYLSGDTATISNSVFHLNEVTVITIESNAGAGGAVYMFASKAGFSKCIFTNNKATGNGNGPYENGGGGAVYMYSVASSTEELGEANIKFESCGFYNNKTGDNPGAWGGAATHIIDSGKMKVAYANCVFSGNNAQNDGGAIANYARYMGADIAFVPSLNTSFTNCTFSNNTAGKTGGALYYDNLSTNNSSLITSKIENSILYGNTAGSSGPQIKFEGNNFIGPVVANSLIQGGHNATIGVNGGNIIGGNPLFVNAADPDGADNKPGTSDDGLRVSDASLVINTGSNLAKGILGISTDFAGEARLQGPKIDMGAYERTTVVNPPVVKKIYWLKEWSKPKPGCSNCPWTVNLLDQVFPFHPKKHLKGFPANFEWKSKAQLIIYPDSAIVTGRIASQINPSIQFEVYLKLVEANEWINWSAKNRTYSALTKEAKQVADQNYQNWQFWVLSDESRLTGKGAVSGALKLTHSPNTIQTGFQLGLGANDQDGDFGLNGEFDYNGVLYYRKARYKVCGKGSLNADAFLCEKDCSPKVENKTIARVDFSEAEKNETKPAYLVYPNPVKDRLTVELAHIQQGTYQFNLYDLKGQLVHKASTQLSNGMLTIDVRALSSGLYRLEAVSPDGKIEIYKIMHY
jgi:predicted outer membrane repeat protein